MFAPRPARRLKRRLSLPDLTVLTAVYACDFALLVGQSPGLFLVASWAFFVINLAVIILYAPRGWEPVLLALLVVSCLVAVAAAAPSRRGQPGPCASHRA
jgi:hypothetical protein